MAGLARQPAFAGVHGGHQLEARGIGDVMVGPRHDSRPRLHGLAQAFEHARLELRQFVEEQHAVMGERHLARPRPLAAAHQSRHGGGVMRGAEGPRQ